MLSSMRRLLLILALTNGFAPAPAPRGLPPLQMKKPSPALEAGPLPGLSQTNYNVLIGVTALGVDTRSSDAEWYLETDRSAAVLKHAQSTSTPGPRENPTPRLTHDELRLLHGFGQGHG